MTPAWRSVPMSEVAAAGGRLDARFYLARSNSNMPKAHITPEALRRLTPLQLETLKGLVVAPDSDLEVFVAFELPDDFVAFTYRGIYGGIDPEGEVST